MDGRSSVARLESAKLTGVVRAAKAVESPSTITGLDWTGLDSSGLDWKRSSATQTPNSVGLSGLENVI